MVLLDTLVVVVLPHLDAIKGCPSFQFEALQGTVMAILQHTWFYQHVSSSFPPFWEPASRRPFSLCQVQCPRWVSRELSGPQHHPHLQAKAARWLLLSHDSSVQIHPHNRRVCSSSAIPHSSSTNTAVCEQGLRSCTAHTIITKTNHHKTRMLLGYERTKSSPAESAKPKAPKRDSSHFIQQAGQCPKARGHKLLPQCVLVMGMLVNCHWSYLLLTRALARKKFLGTNRRQHHKSSSLETN